MVKLPRSFASAMKILFAFAVFLAVAQIALGLAGIGVGLRGNCSEEMGAATIDSEGKLLESRKIREGCSVSSSMVAVSAAVAAGGALALGGLMYGSRWPLPAMGAVLAGAVLGLPLGYTIIFGIVPLFLAVFGVLAIHVAAEGRRRTPKEAAP